MRVGLPRIRPFWNVPPKDRCLFFVKIAQFKRRLGGGLDTPRWDWRVDKYKSFLKGRKNEWKWKEGQI